MCYSSMVESQYHRYVRETGAEMDIQQFEEIFGWRCSLPSLRILRAVERWFDDPATDAGRRISELIARHERAQVAQLEAGIFASRKRLADAERILAARQTRAAANEQRIASAKIEKALRDLATLNSRKPSPLDARMFSMRYAPIVVNDGGRNLIRLARYHLRRPGDAADEDMKKPGLYNARRDNLERYWRHQFGHTHALLLMWSFFEWVKRDGRSVELQFQPRTPQLMLVPCLYAVWEGDGIRMPCFAVITDEPPPEIAAAGHDRCPINLTPEAAQRWITPQGRSNPELQGLLDERQKPYYAHEVMAA